MLGWRPKHACCGPPVPRYLCLRPGADMPTQVSAYCYRPDSCQTIKTETCSRVLKLSASKPPRYIVALPAPLTYLLGTEISTSRLILVTMHKLCRAAHVARDRHRSQSCAVAKPSTILGYIFDNLEPERKHRGAISQFTYPAKKWAYSFFQPLQCYI